MTGTVQQFFSNSTSRSLILGLRNRDPDSWRRFVRLYGPLIYHWARQCGLQENDIADVLQDVLHDVDRGIDRFRFDQPGSTFRGWLWVITRNRIANWYGDQKHQPRGTGGSAALNRLQELPDAPPHDAQAEAHFQRGALELIREEFSPTVWQAFWRTAVEQDAVRDVAEDLGLSVWGIYKARARVLRRLREELGEPGDT